MKLIKKETETIYTFEITQVEQLILLGLLSKVIKNEPIMLDDEASKRLCKIARELSNC